jgi:hypothetical protein
MPVDRWGIPFFYASSIRNPFHYQQSNTPKNDSNLGGKDDLTWTSGEEFKMHVSGPTSFYVLRDPGFNDSIGGCNMSFSQSESRGYTNKSNDLRDVEYKCLIKITGGDGQNTLSISGPTGHHTSSNCCQGFSYMFNVSYTDNTPEFRFRKEMWHVSYHNNPIGNFTDSRVNFKISGHGYIGLGYCRYNKKDGRSPGHDSVILEGWFNPNPLSNITNWFMIRRVEDKGGWGDDGDDCDGVKDQVGTWGGEHFRIKSNDSNADFTVQHLSIREIDPSRAFDDPQTPPPTPPPTTVVRKIVYAMVAGVSGSYTGWTITTAHEIVEAQSDPDPFHRFQPDAFFMPSNGEEIADVCGSNHTYADGLTLEGYWSNNDAGCVVPHIFENDLGGSTLVSNPNGGPVLTNAKIYLVFWGSDWATRGTTPTMAGLTNEIQNKLLGTDKEYFSKLSQYGQIQAPTWGGAVSNTVFPVPSGADINDTMGKDVLTDTFNRGLLAVPNEINQDIYIVYIPVGKNIVTANNSSPTGFHDIYKPTITLASTTPPPPPPPGDTGAGSTIQGSFKFQQDINQLRGQSACAGSTPEPPPVGGGGGGGSGGGGGLTRFYSQPPDNQREMGDSDLWQHRTRITERVLSSSSGLHGKIIKQVDIPLQREGTPSASPTVNMKIYSLGGSVIYESPTHINPSTLTVEFVYHTFDFSTNTHVMVTGDRIGVHYEGTSETNYVIVGYIGTDVLTQTLYEQYEGGVWQDKSRELAMDIYE